MHSSPVPPCPETDVVVVGEAIIDIIDTAAGPVEFPGGSGMNVAFGLGRPGVSTAFLTALGRDERSRSIQRHLNTAGVRLLLGAEHLNRTSWLYPRTSPHVVKDTVGAGDSYMSSLIAGLIEDPEDDFGYGKLTRVGTAASLAAAITVGRHGANPPTRGELIRSLELAQTYRKNSDD